MSQNTHNFHSGDLCKLLQVERHVLRVLLDFEPLSSHIRTRRSATSFSAMDALFLVVMSRLHTLGFAPKALQEVSAAIYQTLQRPVAAGSDDVLRLSQSSERHLVVATSPSQTEVIEVSIPLRPVRRQLLRYTGADQIVGQAELALLGPVLGISPRRATRRSHP